MYRVRTPAVTDEAEFSLYPPGEPGWGVSNRVTDRPSLLETEAFPRTQSSSSHLGQLVTPLSPVPELG